jgi:hypothetical protein
LDVVESVDPPKGRKLNGSLLDGNCQDRRRVSVLSSGPEGGLLIQELTGEETRLERLHFGHKQLPLPSEGDELLAPAPRTKVLPDFVEGRTESLCGGEDPKTEHGVVTLFDSSMVLLDAAVEDGPARTQWNRVCSATFNWRAAAAMLCPDFTKRTASCSNSSVYCAPAVFFFSVILAPFDCLSKGYVLDGQAQNEGRCI